MVAAVAVVAGTTAAVAADAAQSDNRPLRIWSFDEHRAQRGETRVAEATELGGRLDVSHEFGQAAFVLEPNQDEIARGRITATPNGKTYDVYAQAPIGLRSEVDSVIGGRALLQQFQSFQKRSDDATLRITISQAFIQAIDANGGLQPSETNESVAGQLTFVARAYAESAGDGQSGDFFVRSGGAFISGRTGDWTITADTFSSSTGPFWDFRSFLPDFDVDDDGGSHATLSLPTPLSMDVDLSSVRRGELFALHVTLVAEVFDDRGRESTVEAYLRDPVQSGPALVETTGLKRLGAPTFPEPPDTAPPAAQCPGGAEPQAGTLQFSEPAYLTGESGLGPFVLVTRTGGSVGAASATVTTQAGTAEAGADYTEVNTTVAFADGDSAQRLVRIPILPDDRIEDSETFNVSLSDPACASLGTQTTTTVTIADEDTPPEVSTFTIGGTVTGLEGTGLVLSNQGEMVTIDADGPFAFPIPKADGVPYEVLVHTEPTNPNQHCTVTNPVGTIRGADVTDIDVQCSTLQAPGLDPTFGSGGVASVPISNGSAEGVAIQTDGKIVSAGRGSGGGGNDFFLTRHDVNGVLDPTFGGDGIVSTDFPSTGGPSGGVSEAYDVAIQPDGKIVAVGRGGANLGIARFNADGTLDTSFGAQGLVSTDFAGGLDQANRVVLQPDGKIVVAGQAFDGDLDVAAARYNVDGSPDTGFGDGGKITTDTGLDDVGTAVALAPSGEIVVAGHAEQGKDMVVVRYDSQGELDASFGSGGVVVTDFGGFESLHGVAVRPDGRIVAVGETGIEDPRGDFVFVQYQSNGVLDPSIGGGSGRVIISNADLAVRGDHPHDLVLEPDGTVTAVGHSNSDFLVVRFRADGSLDATFDGDGVQIIDVRGTDIAHGVAIQADGKIVVVGSAFGGQTTEFALVRINP